MITHDNYDIAAVNARSLFLKWDQVRMIERCGLDADADTIRIRFLNSLYAIERKTGIVMRAENGETARFNEVMAIYDLLCRDEPIPPEKGVWKATHALSYAGTTSPSENSLSAKTAAFMQKNADKVDEVLAQYKTADFPIGDHAIIFPVFDCMSAVFQFWEGDDEDGFPPSVRYLWDETAPTRLRFETLWYVKGEFESRILKKIGEAY